MVTNNNNNSDGILSLHDRCTRELPELYEVITKLMAGEKAVRMRTSDRREIEYQQGNLDALLRQYNYYWRMCGADSGLPDLGSIMSSGLTRRGPPAGVC